MCGNGAMIAELGDALRLAGVKPWMIYEEPFFNSRALADPELVARLRDRLAGGTVDSPVLAGEAEIFVLERPLGTRRLAG